MQTDQKNEHLSFPVVHLYLQGHPSYTHRSFILLGLTEFGAFVIFLLFFSFLSFLLLVRYLLKTFSSYIHPFFFFHFLSVFVFPPSVSSPSFTPLITSHYHNQAPGASFGPSSPTERAQWRRVSSHPVAPSANRLPLLRPVC